MQNKELREKIDEALEKAEAQNEEEMGCWKRYKELATSNVIALIKEEEHELSYGERKPWR